MSRQEVRVAVVGCGAWGVNLIRNFHALGALVAVCDASRATLEATAAAYPGVRAEPSYERLLTDPTVDAVVIATPVPSHFRLAEAALLAGKDVFVEKPLALRYVEGERLTRLACLQGRILMVGHLLEYHPAIRSLLDLVAEGALGQIHYIYSNRLNLGRVRREENILWSFAPHDIAVVLRLIGDMPFEVTATGGAYLQPNIADVTVTNLHFDSGVRAHIFVSWLHPYKEQRLVVIGSERMAVFDDVRTNDKLVLYDQGVDWIDGQPVPRRRGGTPVPLPPDEPRRRECAHFLECIRERKPPLTDGAEGVRVLEVLQACQRSLQTNGALVALGTPRHEVVNL